MKKIVLLTLLLAIGFAQEYNLERDFTGIFSTIEKGDISATGAPVLCAKTDEDECDWNYQGYLFDIDPKTLYEDPDIPYNSSSAKLNLPENVTGSDILWAGLYWQGHVFGLGTCAGFDNNITRSKNIILRDPRGNLHNLVSSKISYYGYCDKNAGSGNKGYRLFYQNFVDITNIVKNSLDQNHRTFTVGNLFTTLEKDIYYIADTKLSEMLHRETRVKWGNWGGWSIIVAYKDNTDSLKNIALFDGFKFLLPPFGGGASLTIELPDNSFYTPKYGNISSKTIIFAAGAEKKIARDKLEVYNKDEGWKVLSNALNPENNQINDTISYLGEQINSTRIFNPGIDLDVFNTSNFLAHGQTTTKIRITMEAYSNKADQAFVGFVGISNDVYEPKICYIETLYTQDWEKIDKDSEPLNIGDKVIVSLTIRNDDNETADDVKVYKTFDENVSGYVRNSTEVKNIGEVNFTLMTDEPNDDLVTYYEDNDKLEVKLGRNANANRAGIFEPTDTAYVNFLTSIATDQNISFSYTTSYLFKIGTQTFHINGPLPKCIDFNNTITVARPDAFNVVNARFTGQTDPLDENDSLNSLYTQVANKPFNVKILALKDDLQTLNPSYSGQLTLYVTDMNDNNHTISTVTITPNPVTFNNQSTQQVNVNIQKAYRNLRFKIITDKGKTIFSRDAFSVKPQTYTFETNESYLIGGKNYRIDINSTTNSSVVGGYDQVLGSNTEKNGTLKLALPSTCTTLSSTQTVLPVNITFSDGTASTVFVLYDNVGDINFSLYDTEWTDIDQITKSNGTKDCIENDYSSIPDSVGKVGCGIHGSTILSFHPKKFELLFNIEDANQDANFTYIANVQDMSSKGTITVKAVLEDGSTATNYTAGCFANDINTTIELATNNSLSWSDTRNRILFFDDLNISTNLLTSALAKATFKTSEGNFTHGLAFQNIHFNFQRKVDVPDAPFDISNSDFNLSTQEYNGNTKGKMASIPSSSTSHFFYARVHSPDESVNTIDGNEGDVYVYYEIYNPSSTPSVPGFFPPIIGSIINTFFSNLPMSTDSTDWYINKHHTSTDGNINQILFKGTNILATGHAPLAKATLGSLTNGKHQLHVKYTGSTAPYIANLDINASSWLIYNKYDPSATTNSFKVKFTSPGIWMGVGENFSDQVESNQSRHNKYRIEW